MRERLLPVGDAILVYEHDGWTEPKGGTTAPNLLGERAQWSARGWAAAFDLYTVAMGQSVESQVVDIGATLIMPSNDGAIIEHYPARFDLSALSASAVFEALRHCETAFSSRRVQCHVALFRVEGFEAGWYDSSGELLIPAERDRLAQDLERLAPVAYGRADFEVDVTVVVSVEIDLDSGTEQDYLDSLLIGGVALGELEGYASDQGWTTRGNYAVGASFSSIAGFEASKRLAVGAVSWAGRRGW